MPERLECEVLQKARYINTLTFTFTFDLGGQEVKDQGHRRPKLYLEDWRGHHCRPLESSIYIEAYNKRRKCCLEKEMGVLRNCPLPGMTDMRLADPVSRVERTRRTT